MYMYYVFVQLSDDLVYLCGFADKMLVFSPMPFIKFMHCVSFPQMAETAVEAMTTREHTAQHNNVPRFCQADQLTVSQSRPFRVLVTGGSGYIGEIASFLQEHGVSVIERDMK